MTLKGGDERDTNVNKQTNKQQGFYTSNSNSNKTSAQLTMKSLQANIGSIKMEKHFCHAMLTARTGRYEPDLH